MPAQKQLQPAQLQKIWLLSDTLLYPEAVDFMQRMVKQGDPLPMSQVNGLLNITASNNYAELLRFVLHQRDRNWPFPKMNIKRFYTSLEVVLGKMQRERLRSEFHLLQDVSGRSTDDIRQEIDALMALLAREFIQHVLAENGVLLQQAEEERKKPKGQWVGGQGGERNRQQAQRGGSTDRQQNRQQQNNRRSQWQ